MTVLAELIPEGINLAGNQRKDRVLILVAAAAWTGFLVFTLLLPRIPRVPLISDSAAGILGHLVGHFLLVLLLYLVGVGWRPVSGKRLGAAIFSVAASIFLGLLFEGVQALSIIDRTAEISDVVLAIWGSIAGALAVCALVSFKVPQRFVSNVIAGGAGVLIILVGSLAATQDLSLPRAGDHWHAAYRLTVCGEHLEPLPGIQAGIHTHGRGTVHIHPRNSEQAGRNATFASFLVNSGGSLTEDSWGLPSGERHSNGDRCPDGRPGLLTLFVNGEAVTPITEYVFKDLDQIALRFGPTR